MKNNLNYQFLAKKQNQYFLKHVAAIFIRLELNFNNKLKNSTQFPLSIDCLKDDSRLALFKIVANTVEHKIVHSLEVIKIHAISSEKAFNILEDILLTSSYKFVKPYLQDSFSPLSFPDFALNFSLCDLVVWNYILNYFSTGDPRNLQKQQSLNLSKNLLEEHLLVLLDHFVIKLSNIVMDLILYSDEIIISRDCLNNICQSSYLAQRYLINLKNNLLLLKGLDFYIYTPKFIYENKYSLLTVDSGMILSKSIYFDRQKELAILSKPQLIILLLLEVQDLILPKIKNFVYLLGKSLIYIFSYLLGSAIKIVTSRSA
nr:Ycf55 [Erythrotrichia welwitschii]